jgi:hypothetical protein
MGGCEIAIMMSADEVLSQCHEWEKYRCGVQDSIIDEIAGQVEGVRMWPFFWRKVDRASANSMVRHLPRWRIPEDFPFWRVPMSEIHDLSMVKEVFQTTDLRILARSAGEGQKIPISWAQREKMSEWERLGKRWQ